jgi:hypothetical protein
MFGPGYQSLSSHTPFQIAESMTFHSIALVHDLWWW